MKRLNYYFLLLCFFIANGVVGQVNYYVNNNGNNQNDGLTDATAWADLSHLNSFTGFNAGDRIHLKRGDQWNDRLYLQSSIIPDSLEITAYGYGAKPKIIGNGTGHTNPAIRVEGIKGIKISYLEVTSPSSVYVMWFDDCQDIYVDSCEIHDNASGSRGHGIIVGEQPRVFITRNIFYNLGSEGFYGGVKGSKDRRAVFAYNHIYNINQDGGTGDCVQFNLAAYCIDVHHNIFDNRNVPISGKGPFVMSQDTGNTLTVIEHNTFYGNSGDTYGCSVGRADSTIVRYNTFKSEYATGQALGGNFDVAYGNIMIGWGNSFSLGVENNIYHIYNNYLEPNVNLLYQSGNDTNTVYFYNNICTKERFRWGGTSNYYRDYNLYKDPSGIEANGIYEPNPVYWSDSLFVDSTYRVKGTAKVVDAGTNVGLTIDRFGNSIPYNNIPDIGVHEYEMYVQTSYQNSNPIIEEFQLYPNPTNGTVYLPEDKKWQLYSLNGELLKRGNSKQIDLSSFPVGLYLICSEGKRFKVLLLGK